jgi:hypothetical protein
VLSRSLGKKGYPSSGPTPYAAAVPVTSCQIWNRWAMTWRYVGPAGAFEQKVTVLRVMVTQTLFASCDAACTPVKVKMHRGLILG